MVLVDVVVVLLEFFSPSLPKVVRGVFISGGSSARLSAATLPRAC